MRPPQTTGKSKRATLQQLQSLPIAENRDSRADATLQAGISLATSIPTPQL
jgi:hypothetical protein